MHLYPLLRMTLLVNYFSLWSQHKCTAFTIFSSKIMIISYKMLIITGISNDKTNELTIFGILCRNVTLFYQQELPSLFQVQGKLKTYKTSKLNLSSSCFIANGNHVKTVWPHIVVFSKYDFFHFWDNVHLFKYYPVKLPQNWFNFFKCSNETCIQVSNFLSALDKYKKVI